MVDLTYLKKTTSNDFDVILQLVEIFKLQLPELKINILNSYKNKDWDVLKRAAHKAKNSFKMMGLHSASENLKQIEIECSKENNINCASNIDLFISEYDEVVYNINKKIKELNTDTILKF